MSPTELGFNAGALALALAVVKLSELAIRTAVSKRNGNSKQGNSQDFEAIRQALARIATNGEHQLETMRRIERQLDASRIDLHNACRERTALQISVDKLHDRWDKEFNLRTSRTG